MSLNIKTTVDQLSNGSVLHIFDSTLDYHLTDNPGGWCTDQLGPNPRRVDVTQIEITIGKGDLGETIVITDADEIADYLDPTHGRLINAATLFGAAYAVFEDGIYTITVSFSGTWLNPSTGLSEAFTADDEIYEAFLWTLYYQIRHLVIAIEVPIVKFLEAYNASLLNTLFDSIIYNCEYGNIENAQKIIDYLTDVLENNTSLTELFKNFENYE